MAVCLPEGLAKLSPLGMVVPQVLQCVASSCASGTVGYTPPHSLPESVSSQSFGDSLKLLKYLSYTHLSSQLRVELWALMCTMEVHIQA